MKCYAEQYFEANYGVTESSCLIFQNQPDIPLNCATGKKIWMYVTGVNCTAETAFAEMKAVQERFDKTVGNVAYHAYQSFKTGEVTPQLAHKLGVELAKRMWGDQYQVLVATHFNTGTYHNHLVINSVNMWNGKKFNCNEGAYWKLRSISDELCKENGLSVIKNPKGKTPCTLQKRTASLLVTI